MICTCTLNPSLDYYLEFEESVQEGKTNRSTLEYYEAGGKGINVSIVLNNLLIPTRAFGFLGGFSREFYIKLLQKYEYVRPNFTYIEGHTRINVKVQDHDVATALNAAGPYITDQDMKNLYEKADRLDEGDYFVLGGTCQSYLKEDVEKMIINCIHNDVRVCLDSDCDLMYDLLEHKPFMVKTTSSELCAHKNVEETFEHTVEACKEMYALGARHVLAVYDKKQAILVCESGVYVTKLLRQQKAVSMVGASDALTAGFLMNYLRSSDPVDSFKFGSCCGVATAYSKGLATREKIDSFYSDVEVELLQEA